MAGRHFAFSLALAVAAAVAFPREIEERDSPTNVDGLNYPDSEAGVPAVVCDASFAPISGIKGVDFDTPESKPLEKVKYTKFDAGKFRFLPVSFAPETFADAKVPVISDERLVDISDVVMDGDGFCELLPTLVGFAGSVEFMPISVDGIPMVAVTPTGSPPQSTAPMSVLLPIVTESGHTAVCIVTKTDGAYVVTVVDISSGPLPPQPHLSVDVDPSAPLFPIAKLNRFMRYGKFPYPSRLWKLQNAGASAEASGNTDEADAIYREFISVFDHYVLHMNMDDME